MADFKFRRVTCRGDDYSCVEISVAPSAGEFSFNSLVAPDQFPDERYLPCIEQGVRDAFDKAELDPNAYSVTLETARDITGEASPAGFRACASGAVLKCLGKESLAPNPGLINET